MMSTPKFECKFQNPRVTIEIQKMDFVLHTKSICIKKINQPTFGNGVRKSHWLEL